MTPLVKSAELAYRGVNRLRRSLYHAGILKPRRLPRPVISIGNIAAGGSGKTPAVIAVCRFLASRGLRVAVLTRGYGRSDTTIQESITSLNPDKYGDEPVLIKQSVNVDVIVGADRHNNAKDYLQTNNCDVFVLDDGFQHLQLHRDLDIVIDAPAEFYREGRAALADADIVIPRRVRTIVPEELRGREIFAFAGLARNEQFFDALRAEGLIVAGTAAFPDHHRYTRDELASIRAQARGLPIVTSGKDAVKVADADVAVADAEFVIDDAVLERVASLVAPAVRGAARRRRRRKNRVLQRIEYVAFRAAARVARSLPQAVVHRLGTSLGAVARVVVRRRDRLAMENLRASFPDRDARDLRKVLDQCWRHFGRELLVYLRMRDLSVSEVAERLTITHLELLEESIARGRGTIVISAHWGSWEVAGIAAMALAPSVRTVARPLDNDLLERDLQRLRERTGAEVVDRRRAARVLMRALAENEVVVLLPDQAVQPREGVLVPFLGRPAWTTPAPAKLALRGGATILFAFCIPEGLRHRLEFEEPIRVDELSESERDPVELTRRINDVISRRIRERPDLWLWMHDRWKGPGESGAADGV